MSVQIGLYEIHLRESDRERCNYLDSLSQARSDDERELAQRALDDHDVRIRGVQTVLESKARIFDIKMSSFFHLFTNCTSMVKCY